MKKRIFIVGMCLLMQLPLVTETPDDQLEQDELPSQWHVTLPTTTYDFGEEWSAQLKKDPIGNHFILVPLPKHHSLEHASVAAATQYGEIALKSAAYTLRKHDTNSDYAATALDLFSYSRFSLSEAQSSKQPSLMYDLAALIVAGASLYMHGTPPLEITPIALVAMANSGLEVVKCIKAGNNIVKNIASQKEDA